MEAGAVVASHGERRETVRKAAPKRCGGGPRRQRWQAAVAALGLALAAPGLRAQDGGPEAAPGVESLPPFRPAEVTDRSEAAIERGLRFLAREQLSNGSFGKSSRETEAWSTYPTAMTSLCGLAFFASGSTPSRGPYARQLRRITAYLLERCAGTRRHRVPGLLYDPRADEERPMYCHAFAMTYLALVFAQETDPGRRERIRDVLREAVELTHRTQSDDGGWGYWPNYREDEGTLVVTQLQGLRACRDAGIFVPSGLIDEAVRYIDRSTNPDGSVRYRVRARRWNTRPGVTCAAVVALWQAGRQDEPLFRRIADNVNRTIAPSKTGDWRRTHHAEYVQYFLAQSQHVQGGARWDRYYRRASRELVSIQRRDGSWEGRDGGDIYGTAIALLILQLPYDRLAVYQR